jgi:hypothetical protein
MVTLLLHAITIMRTGVWTVLPRHPDSCNSSPRLALLRIASLRCRPVVQTVTTVFPYLCLRRKSFYLSNTEERPDMLLRRPDGCNPELFKTFGHWWESRWKCHVVWMEVADWWASEHYTGLSGPMLGIWLLCLENCTESSWSTNLNWRLWI